MSNLIRNPETNKPYTKAELKRMRIDEVKRMKKSLKDANQRTDKMIAEAKRRAANRGDISATTKPAVVSTSHLGDRIAAAKAARLAGKGKAKVAAPDTGVGRGEATVKTKANAGFKEKSKAADQPATRLEPKPVPQDESPWQVVTPFDSDQGPETYDAYTVNLWDAYMLSATGFVQFEGENYDLRTFKRQLKGDETHAWRAEIDNKKLGRKVTLIVYNG